MARKSKTAAQANERAATPIRITVQGCEMRPIGEIIPYARNAKVHGEAQLERLRASLRRFGFVRPLLVDAAGNLLAGHGTLEAARREGMEAVPVVVATDLTDEERRAYILADNRLAELAEWDQESLSLELEELGGLGFDLEPIGFDLEALDGGDEAQGLEEKPEREADAKTHYTCPKCGFEFDA